MRSISIPINLELLTEENISVYIESARACKAERIFLIGLDNVYEPASLMYTQPKKVAFALSEFKKEFREVGFWVSSLGHGSALNFMSDDADPEGYTPLEGVNGEISAQGYCPLDPKFRNDMGKGLETLASFRPDLIMLDDDFRMHSRSYSMGCFCKTHLKEYYKRIGETVPRDKIERLVWSGGENKYRSEYMRLMSDTLFDFARELSARIEAVSPETRFGFCSCLESWDANGSDAMELAKAFAGKNKPFTRTIGAPYWDRNIIKQLESTRLQFAWCRGSGVEIMSEGDTYPRPRYNYPSKPLELFDLLLIANNAEDPLLNYIFDYNHDLSYENSYMKRYLKNEALRNDVEAIFKDKSPVGIEIFQKLHITEKMDFPENPPGKIHNRIVSFYQVHSDQLLSENTIPTCFDKQGYPVFLAGENAKYIEEEHLKNGAILDAKAAEILTKRGIDVGLLSACPCDANTEAFEGAKSVIKGLGASGLYSFTCKPSCEILSRYLPTNDIASYRLENSAGQRFLVLGYDAYFADLSRNYFNSYYRQTQLTDTVEWLCGNPLPAVITKNPCLYMLAAKKDDTLSIALANLFPDDIDAPVLRLDKEYSSIRFVNCKGTLKGNTVYIEDLPPYGFAAFEVL